MADDATAESGAETVDEIVRRLAAVTDEILALDADDFAARFRLERERDELRARAEAFRERKDERRTTAELEAELAARREQLAAIQGRYVNRALQAASASGHGGGGERAMDAANGATPNLAVARGMGEGTVTVRIAEIEQELSRR